MKITITNVFKVSLLIGVVLLIQNCKSYQDPIETNDLAKESLANRFEVPEFWEASTDTSDVGENWYKDFNDKALNALIKEAIDTTNLSIIYQLALIEQSSAQRDLTQSDKNVKIGYGADYLGLSSSNTGSSQDVVGGGGISWEADLWGKIETGVLSADENLKASIYNYNYTKQSIAATTSKLYFQIGTLNEGLKIGNDFIKVNDTIKNLLKVREDIGVIDMKGLYLIKAQISSINNIIEGYKNDLQISTRQLEVVLGRYPKNDLIIDWSHQNLEPVYQIGNPFELINRRPDLKRDEALVRSQFYLTEQAKLAKYPDLVLSADIGFSTVSDLIFGVAGSFFGPIYSGGAIDSQIESATAVQKKALMTYGLSILNAFNEVETALASEKFLLEKQKFITEGINESKNAYQLMLEQYAVGRVGLFEVLQTQMEWILRELDLVKNNGELYRQRVQLYLALGGDITNN